MSILNYSYYIPYYIYSLDGTTVISTDPKTVLRSWLVVARLTNACANDRSIDRAASSIDHANPSLVHNMHTSQHLVSSVVPHCDHFRKMSTFYSHVSRYHGILRRQTKYRLLYTAGIMLKCNVTGCDKIMNFAELIRHLKGHIDSRIKVNCWVAVDDIGH